ncbi:hypothetical protein [Azohydromonas lata]|uniref:TnsA endonuclease N-terminal domain-containing protein n=1 Tax=Azohydromonas lata TaxID=45677 RepID=A0ABU5IGV4_9BURK|nr:hypothetical protein [Azohydromonas lata]MDZ5457875.1 hypothetical protein [Azohydromonas lata]
MATFTERVLILCKTYPSPSASYVETSCVAGVTAAGKLIRLFPVPFRLIADEQQFRKWQWITVRMEKAPADHRPESHRVFVDTVQCEGEPLPSGKQGWPRRMEHLRNVPIFSDFDAVQAARESQGTTLALLRPNRILELQIKPTKSADWTPEELAKLKQDQIQTSLLDTEAHRKPAPLLQKIPFDFHYRYECLVDGKSVVYRHKLVDWEAGALYRRLLREHGPSGWEAPFRAKYEQELPSTDLLMLLGTMHRFKDKWLAVSVICPPKPQSANHSQESLF